MKKYVIKLGGHYVRDVFIVCDLDSECMVTPIQVETREAAMTFKEKRLANMVAKIIGECDVEEIGKTAYGESGISMGKLDKAITDGFWMADFCGFDENRSAVVRLKFIDVRETPARIDFLGRTIRWSTFRLSFDDYGKKWALTKEELE